MASSETPARLECSPQTGRRGRLPAVPDALLEQALGERIGLDALTDENEARRYWRSQGWPDVTIDVTLFAMRTFADRPDTMPETVTAQMNTAQHVLGRPARSFADWVAQQLGQFARDPAAEWFSTGR